MTTDPAELEVLPAIVQITADAWDLELVAESLAEEFAAEVRAVRGGEMQTREEAIAECAAALGFGAATKPGWEGFAAGLEALGVAAGPCVLLVVDAPEVLQNEPDRHWRSFVRALAAAVEKDRLRDGPDRPRLVQVVFHAAVGSGDALAARLATAFAE